MAIKRLKRLAGNILHHLDNVVFTDAITPTAGIDNQDVTLRRLIAGIGDPEVIAAIAKVSNKDLAQTAYALSTRVIEPGAARDAFSRLRVSNPVTLFDSQQQYSDNTTDVWNHLAVGAASSSHDHDQACVNIATTTGATDKYTRQTQRYIRYQPGKSQLIFVTFDFKALDTGAEKCVGYYDDDNGVFFKFDGTTASVVLRSKRTGSVVDTEITSNNWNIDPFDGTGPSGVTFDPTKAQIAVIDLQWLAVGQVRIGTDVDGIIYYAHHFHWANENSGVYMSTANLPVRYEIVGNGVAASMDCICASVMSEGGFVSDLGHEHVTPNGVAAKACPVTVETPVMSIRPAALHKTYPNRGEYVPEGISFYVTAFPVLLRMYHGSTLTGAAFAAADAESGVEYDTAATAHTGGHLTNSEFGAAASGGKAFSTTGGAKASNRIYLNLNIDGTIPDHSNFTVVGTGIGGTAQVHCNIHWTEIK